MAKLNDVEIDDYLKQCIDMVPEAINEEFARMSADYAYWNEKYAAANRAFLLETFKEKKATAMVYLAKKAALVASGNKATEAMVEAEVHISPEYEAAQVARITAEADRDYLKGVLETLRSKREMLISAGAHLRQEAAGDPVIRERNYLKRAEKDF